MFSVVSQESLTKNIYLPAHLREGSQTVEMIFHQAQNPNLISTLYYMLYIILIKCKYYNEREISNIFLFGFFSEIWQVLFYFYIFYIFCYSIVHSSRLQMNFYFCLLVLIWFFFFHLKPIFTRSRLLAPISQVSEFWQIDSSRVS